MINILKWNFVIIWDSFHFVFWKKNYWTLGMKVKPLNFYLCFIVTDLPSLLHLITYPAFCFLFSSPANILKKCWFNPHFYIISHLIEVNYYQHLFNFLHPVANIFQSLGFILTLYGLFYSNKILCRRFVDFACNKFFNLLKCTL